VLSLGSVSIPVIIGVATVGITVVATQLTITGRHPRGLYDLFVGVARWALRVVAYVALLTDQYPPFRLDQGTDEPDVVLGDPAPDHDRESREVVS
jgi:hypothetical protein